MVAMIANERRRATTYDGFNDAQNKKLINEKCAPMAMPIVTWRMKDNPLYVLCFSLFLFLSLRCGYFPSNLMWCIYEKLLQVL